MLDTPLMAGFDVIVVGVGGMGSAAAYHLARRGQRVLGLERFDVPNEMGSSHGVTRIIRLAYYEHSAYVPLLRRAYELWHELERERGEQLLYTTGSVDAGGEIFAGSLRSCEDHDLPHEVLDGSELARRFPAYRLPPEMPALLQPAGGFLLPERCIVAHVERAQAHGADVRARERVLEWEETASGVRVRSDRGVYEAERLVLTPGAWASPVARLPVDWVVAERQVLAWFQPARPELFDPERFPVFNVAAEDGHYYGFPRFGVPGLKLGRYHHLDEQVDPEAVAREPTLADEAVLRRFTERYFPDGAGPTMALKVCLFENSPDEHFLLDVHPECGRAVVGEVLADLSLDGGTRHEIGFLRLGRLG
jgi:sarcosine oxidase